MIARVALAVLLAQALWGQSQAEIRRAVGKALPVLEKSAGVFVEKRACVSCHHNILPTLAIHMARDRGFAVDASVLKAVEEKTFKSLRGENALDDAIQAVSVNDPTPNDSYLLMAADAAGVLPDAATEVIARRLVKWQRDGHWVTSDFRPPHSSSLFTATATAVRAIQLYAPGSDSAIQEARRWLVENRPLSTEDAAFLLMGLKWAAGSDAEIRAARRDLLAMQKPNGGWAQTAQYAPDAYSTGEALYAMGSSGDSAFQRGAKFLISTQAADGTWRVHTRMLSPADVSPRYFTTGFPYQKDEYLSYAGSVWAVMGLLSALPGPSGGVDRTGLIAPPEAWVRTALFGSVDELRALLDGGLDVNRKTARGTTLLMMAATDPERVRLLISRGADVRARAESGVDALTIACAYRGTAESVKLLLDAGASPKPPEGRRARSSPLVFASMTGDLDEVRLLLAHGADPEAGAGGNTPLSQAATFGYADVVRALIGAGASVSMREASGINLLHWAAITNRPQLVPLLVQAGVPINVTDDNGYTPLMYAATVDFGDTEIVRALLKNGASTVIPNGEGLTPAQQAHRLKLAGIEAALRQTAP